MRLKELARIVAVHLFRKGSERSQVDTVLLYHGCIPMTEDGDFELVELNGEAFKGKALMDYLDSEMRNARRTPFPQRKRAVSG